MAMMGQFGSPIIKPQSKLLNAETLMFANETRIYDSRNARSSIIQGLAVPILVNFDDTKQIVEMTVVFPPCILDFAKAYVDRSPDFSAKVLRDWREETADLFDSDWESVQYLLEELQRLGIFYFDAKPGNIRFRN
jgi:hypothetical protein